MSPIYTFYCDACKVETEELFSSYSRPDFVSCPECQGPAKLAVGSAHFKVKGANAANNYSGDSNWKWIKPKAPK